MGINPEKKRFFIKQHNPCLHSLKIINKNILHQNKFQPFLPVSQQINPASLFSKLDLLIHLVNINKNRVISKNQQITRDEEFQTLFMGAQLKTHLDCLKFIAVADDITGIVMNEIPKRVLVRLCYIQNCSKCVLFVAKSEVICGLFGKY